MSIPAGTRVSNQENLFLGTQPKSIVIGMVNNDVFTGAYDKNPFAFKHYDLEFLAIYVDGQQFPAKPLQPQYFMGSAVREFYQLALATGKHLKNNALSIDREEFLKGRTLYAFNLTPDEECAQHLSLIKSGNLNLETRFRQPLAQTINLIVYTIFDSVIEVSNHRQVLILAMNTVQLTAIMDRISANTHFLGVLTCDQLPERPIQKLPSSVILNTHSSDLPGEHWLAVYITKDRIGCFFDSFGKKPDHKMFSPTINILRTTCSRLQFSNKHVQDLVSITCGEHSFFSLSHVKRLKLCRCIVKIF